MNQTPGTLAFLLRWHILPFVAGLAIAAAAAYQLWTFTPPEPSALDAVATSPAVEYFKPVMWIVLLSGALISGRAWLKAWTEAHP